MPELVKLLIGGATATTTTTTLTASTTLTQHFDIIKIDRSSGLDIDIKLPDDTSIFLNKNPTEFISIGDFANVNNEVKITGETPSNLNETDQEIILDIELGVKVFFCEETGKYQSTNGFSEKRKLTLQNMSSSVMITGYDKDNFVAVDTTSQVHETVKILQAGTGWIIDRTNNDYTPKPFKVSWIATNGIDTDTPNQDGSHLIYISKTGVFTMEVRIEVALPPYSVSGTNANTHLQLQTGARESGTVTVNNPLPQGLVNTPMNVNQALQAVGNIRNTLNPMGIEPMGANLNLRFLAGESIDPFLGWIGNAGGLSPNLDIRDSDLSNAPIILVTRDNIVQVSTTEVNVTLFEDPNNPGTTITMTNNTSKVDFFKGFGNLGLIAEVLGQAQYNTIALAISANERPDFPFLIKSITSLHEVFLNKNETDLAANSTFRRLSAIDLF